MSSKKLLINFKNVISLEFFIILIIFLFSFLSSTTLALSLILSLGLLYQKEIGAIKILNLLTLRTIINPGIGIDIGSWQSLKMIIIFGCSLYLISAILKLEKQKLDKIVWVIYGVLIFSIYNFGVSLAFSSLPTISIFKMISYTLGFLGILIGVAYTFEKIDWVKWLLNLFNLVIIISILLLTSPLSYLRNGISFQGITNQPNMFGIISVLFLAIIFTYKLTSKSFNEIYWFSMTFLTVYLVILSKSRTAFISCLIIISIFLLINAFKKKSYLALSAYSFLFSFLIIITNYFFGEIQNFIALYLAKGQEADNFLYSRSEQISTALSNFYTNPLFGTGFSVPVLPFKSYSFSMNYIMEPGNLLLSLLFYSGIIGLLIFIYFVFQIIWANKNNLIIIIIVFISPFLISMGEMVFFSTNNIGIWCYMFLSLAIFIKEPQKNENLS